jgi:hypothetical protein
MLSVASTPGDAPGEANDPSPLLEYCFQPEFQAILILSAISDLFDICISGQSHYPYGAAGAPGKAPRWGAGTICLDS